MRKDARPVVVTVKLSYTEARILDDYRGEETRSEALRILLRMQADEATGRAARRLTARRWRQEEHIRTLARLLNRSTVRDEVLAVRYALPDRSLTDDQARELRFLVNTIDELATGTRMLHEAAVKRHGLTDDGARQAFLSQLRRQIIGAYKPGRGFFDEKWAEVAKGDY